MTVYVLLRSFSLDNLLHILLCQVFSEILSTWTKESSLPPSRFQPRDGALSSSTFLGINKGRNIYEALMPGKPPSNLGYSYHELIN